MITSKLTTETLFELADKIALSYAMEEHALSCIQDELSCALNGIPLPDVHNPILDLNYNFWGIIRDNFGVKIVLACNSGIDFQSINSRNPKQIFDNFGIDDKETIIVFFTYGKKLILQHRDMPEVVISPEEYEERKRFSEYLSVICGKYKEDEDDEEDEDDDNYMCRTGDTYSTTDTISVDIYYDGAWAASKPNKL
jgi:hypothetical protein